MLDRIRRVTTVIMVALAAALFAVALVERSDSAKRYEFSETGDGKDFTQSEGGTEHSESSASTASKQSSGDEADDIVRGAETELTREYALQKSMVSQVNAIESAKATDIVGASKNVIERNIKSRRINLDTAFNLQAAEASAHSAEASNIVAVEKQQPIGRFQRPSSSSHGLGLAGKIGSSHSDEASKIVSFSEAQMAHNIKYHPLADASPAIAQQIQREEGAEAAEITGYAPAEPKQDDANATALLRIADESRVLASKFQKDIANEAADIVRDAAGHDASHPMVYKGKAVRMLASKFHAKQAAEASSIVHWEPVPPRVPKLLQQHATGVPSDMIATKDTDAAEMVGIPHAHLSPASPAAQPALKIQAEADGIVAYALSKQAAAARLHIAAEARRRKASESHPAAEAIVAHSFETHTSAGLGAAPAVAVPAGSAKEVPTAARQGAAATRNHWLGVGNREEANAWASMSPVSDGDAPTAIDVDYSIYAKEIEAAAAAAARQKVAAATSPAL